VSLCVFQCILHCVIRDEADQDYQLAAGISKDVEADDSILEHTKARLPWLVLALWEVLSL
jgi:Mg/Co/Ni transporter MgtE